MPVPFYHLWSLTLGLLRMVRMFVKLGSRACPALRRLVAVSAQGFADLARLEGLDAGRPTEIPLALVAHPSGQVACARLTMLDLARRGKAETLLRPFVGLLLWHG